MKYHVLAYICLTITHKLHRDWRFWNLPTEMQLETSNADQLNLIPTMFAPKLIRSAGKL